jgi:aspartate-semialdehyde dehydrogenase
MIAVIGASGVVGRLFLSFLDRAVALASRKSEGLILPCQKGYCTVEALEDFDFSRCHTAIFVAGSSVSETYVPKARQSGCLVIDASSFYRIHPDVPLVIPEINSHDLYHHQGLIASPNCTVTPLLMGLKPLHDLFELEEIFAASYQSVSGAGKHLIDQLNYETCDYVVNEKSTSSDKTIAFNVIPVIDKIMEDFSTKEEWKMKVETQKILNNDTIRVTATCARVPVYVGHSVAVHARFKNLVSVEKAIEALSKFPGVQLCDVVTPAKVAGMDDVYVSRLRKTGPCDLSFWTVCDNLRKGAALNIFQILRALPQVKSCVA